MPSRRGTALTAPTVAARPPTTVKKTSAPFAHVFANLHLDVNATWHKHLCMCTACLRLKLWICVCMHVHVAHLGHLNGVTNTHGQLTRVQIRVFSPGLEATLLVEKTEILSER